MEGRGEEMGVGWLEWGADAQASKASCWRTEVVFFAVVFNAAFVCGRMSARQSQGGTMSLCGVTW